MWSHALYCFMWAIPVDYSCNMAIAPCLTLWPTGHTNKIHITHVQTLRLSQKSLNEQTSGRIINLGATDVLRYDFVSIVFCEKSSRRTNVSFPLVSTICIIYLGRTGGNHHGNSNFVAGVRPSDIGRDGLSTNCYVASVDMWQAICKTAVRF